MMIPERAPSGAAARTPARTPSRGKTVAPRRALRRLAVLALSVGLAACGNKGDLYLPGSIEDEARVRLLDSDGTIDESTGATDPTTGPAVAPLTPSADEDDPDDPDDAPPRRTPSSGDGS